MLAERIGVDNILMGTDYPHGDSTWPHTQQTIHDEIRELPERLIRQSN